MGDLTQSAGQNAAGWLQFFFIEDSNFCYILPISSWRGDKTLCFNIFKVPGIKKMRLLRGASVLLFPKFPKPNSSNARKRNDLASDSS